MINQIYSLYGNIFENIQYIEWNIALIVCKTDKKNAADIFEEIQNMTMGQLINYAVESECFDDEDIEELKYILEKRNYLAHHFFKKNDIVKHKNNLSFLKNKIRELQNILNKVQQFNEILSEEYNR